MGRTKIVSIIDEIDYIVNPNMEFGNPEDLLIFSEDEKLNEQVGEVIENILRTLPEIQRSIIIIRFFMGGEDRYTSQQIADVLKVSRKTYYNQLNSALSSLKCALENDPIILAKLETIIRLEVA